MALDINQDFLNNLEMSFPIYKFIKIKKYDKNEFLNILSPEMNLKNPLVFDLKNLDFDEQWGIIKIIEDYSIEKEMSLRFPYPVYIISNHDHGPCSTLLLKDEKELPDFFNKKEFRVSSKESSAVRKNRMIQKALYHSENPTSQIELHSFGKIHKKIYNQDLERSFYQKIYENLLKKKHHD